ncbi:MAG: efflux RND transporter permease subunit [Chloroflexota bacterium]|nr:efflux RND transporter permease subunit [Chloroflexota bacterium]
MKQFFSLLTRLSLRFRGITLLATALISVLGVIAATQLKLELIPPIAFPQTIILAQVTGMTSDEALTLLTEPIEAQLATIPDVVNVESTTTGAIGAVVIARNEFGLNQDRLLADIRTALDELPFPVRRIAAAEGEDAQAFAARLLADLPADVLIYLQRREPTFLFQLSPEVWSQFSQETTATLLAFLAAETEQSTSAVNALQRVVDVSIIPQLETLPIVANISIGGGQALPGDESGMLSQVTTESAATSRLLELPPEVWAIASAKVGVPGALDQSAVDALRVTEVTIPTTAPDLPASWQMDRFVTALDLVEMRSAVRTLSTVFNNFYATGQIVGSLGQTDDLTPEIVTQILQTAPSMIEHFDAEHLAALPDEVFAVLPEDYIASLDGFARDVLAASALAENLTGSDAPPQPIDLPNAWRIGQPQIITFSFDDLPLATYSIAGSGEVAETTSTDTTAPAASAGDTTAATTTTATPAPVTLAEGPALPGLFALLSEPLGLELDTADDLINLQVPPALAEGLGGAQTLSAAEFFNFLTLLADPSVLAQAGAAGDTGAAAPSFDVATALPALVACGVNPLALASGDVNFADAIIGCIDADVIAYLIANDDTFISTLSADVYEYFSDDVLALPEIAAPLPDVWNTLAEQPQFTTTPLRTTNDLIALGDGSASAVLNTINATVPERFAGYEVRLFDSLTPLIMRDLALAEADFYSNLDPAVLLKLSPSVIAALPEAVISALDADTAQQLTAIAANEQPSAAAALASLYTSNIPPADPAAPPINEAWGFVANFYGIELDTADDFFRFPDDFRFATAAEFMNSFFVTAQGANFAPNLFGNLSVEAAQYIQARDASVFENLRSEALQLLPEAVLAALPESVQQRAAEGGTPFVPTAAVTRANGLPALQLTIFKTSDANTVEAFHQVDDLLRSISAANPNIEIDTVFEQASFIEESISGVAREGGLGGIFAVLVILIFLSSGLWQRSPRRLVSIILVGVAVVLLVLATLPNLGAAGGDVLAAFGQVNLLIQVPLVLVLAGGLIGLFWPGDLPYPAWRSTLVTAFSIPVSVLMAFAFMRWVSPAIHDLLLPQAGVPFIAFLLRLFPENITLNIMTLSGLTVAIGRVVDDAIVVLENIFRQIQAGGDRRQAIITGTRDVSIAIFAATVITVVVFLPLGLTGGLIGEFFLPFGLAVTYSLMASFIVAITVVPVLAYLLIRTEDVHEDEGEGFLERLYLPALRWALGSGINRTIVIVIAFATMIIGLSLFAGRPAAFLPDFGEPRISVSIQLPGGTKILETNAQVAELESAISNTVPAEDLESIQVIVGSGGQSLASLFGGGGGVSENQAQVTVALAAQDRLAEYAQQIRTEAEGIFGSEYVSVSAASVSSQGFGGFALVLSGPSEALQGIDARVIETLNNVEGLANVSSNLAQVGAGGDDAPVTYLRVDGQSAVRYTGELETDDSLNVIRLAREAVEAMPDLPAGITVSEGFETEVQTQGFASLFVAMGIAILIVILILIVTFGSLVHWLDIILSIVVAPVGAAVALTLTDRVLGISALIGLLMLIGIVVTNAVVLIDRVMANRYERGMTVRDALLEGGSRRLRPILMTAFATIFALLPLAVGLSEGAIIASELGTVVIGGLLSSTLLTLILVPVAYSLLNPVHEWVSGLLGRKPRTTP